MKLVAELSLYPLQSDFETPILEFIHSLANQPGLELVTNQMSTQVSGEFDVVIRAVHDCLRVSMEISGKQVLVVKYLNADFDIHEDPVLD